MSSPSSVKIANFPEYVAILLTDAWQRVVCGHCAEMKCPLRVDMRTAAAIAIVAHALARKHFTIEPEARVGKPGHHDEE